VWAEDAEHDVQRVRDVADALAGWWPRPATCISVAGEPDVPWEAVLPLYLRQGLPS
jgi:hypothetical protein